MEAFPLKRAAGKSGAGVKRVRRLPGRAAPPPRAIFLVGFMGAGKSSVGRALAERLRWAFIDLDERLEVRHRRKIADIFRQDGEAQFRRWESEELRRIVEEVEGNAGYAAVVALGGGTFVQPANVSTLSHCGYTVFLDAPVEELWERAQMAAGTRPLALSENHFRQLYVQRRSRYMEADHHVQTGGRQTEAVATEIAALLGQVGEGEPQ